MANDTGSNYWFIPGGETPAPPVAPPVQEPVSPFPEVNYLQDPVQLLMNPGGGAAPVSGPSFTPQAAPAAVRLDQPQTIFGPVTPSGYAIPPVDPLSYYAKPSDTPTQYPSTPSTKPPVQPPATEPVAPPSVEPGTHFTPKPLDFGDPFFDNQGNQWIWDESNPEWGYWKFNTTNTPATPPVTTTPPQTGGEPVVTPPKESLVLPPESVTTTPVPQQPTTKVEEFTEPAPSPVYEDRFTVNKPVYNYPTFTPSVTIPGASVSSKPIITPMAPVGSVSPKTVEIAASLQNRYNPGRYDYINYDPNEILTAAMRVLRGRLAGRSLME